MTTNYETKRASPSSYVTTRISGIGSRYDKVGGESAIFARSSGGTVGREFVSFPSLVPLGHPTDLSDIKSALVAEIASASYDDQMMDRLHETAYQTSAVGNSLGSPLLGTADSVSSVTAGDVKSVAGNTWGEDVVVVGTGSGEHGKLVEDGAKAYGSLPKSGGAAVVKAGEKSSFIGSDVR